MRDMLSVPYFDCAGKIGMSGEWNGDGMGRRVCYNAPEFESLSTGIIALKFE